MTTYLTTPQGRHIAYVRTPGKEPGVVFLGGFRSDMTGSKALHLQAWAEATGRAFLRFDYSGHGASRGDFVDGAISDWREDASAVIESADRRAAGAGRVVDGRMDRASSGAGHAGHALPVWSASPPHRISPKRMWEDEFSLADRTRLLEDGVVLRPSDYSDEPYPITRRLIEDGKANLVMHGPLHLPMPVRLLARHRRYRRAARGCAAAAGPHLQPRPAADAGAGR